MPRRRRCRRGREDHSSIDPAGAAARGEQAGQKRQAPQQAPAWLAIALPAGGRPGGAAYFSPRGLRNPWATYTLPDQQRHSMPSLRMLWNHLAPGRRRRRYYFLQVLSKLRDLGVDQSQLPRVFNVSGDLFVGLLTGYDNPPRYVESLAIAAYKVRRPTRIAIYGPTLSALAGVACVVVLRLLLR